VRGGTEGETGGADEHPVQTAGGAAAHDAELSALRQVSKHRSGVSHEHLRAHPFGREPVVGEEELRDRKGLLADRGQDGRVVDDPPPAGQYAVIDGVDEPDVMPCPLRGAERVHHRPHGVVGAVDAYQNARRRRLLVLSELLGIHAVSLVFATLTRSALGA